MKNRPILLATLLIALCMSSCRQAGQRADSEPADSTAVIDSITPKTDVAVPEKLTTEKIEQEIERDGAKCNLVIDMPIGDGRLAQTIRQQIVTMLRQPVVSQEVADASRADDRDILKQTNRDIVRFYCQQIHNELKAHYAACQAEADGYEVAEKVCSTSIMIQTDRPKYVTYYYDCYTAVDGEYDDTDFRHMIFSKLSGRLIEHIIEPSRLKALQPLMHRYIVRCAKEMMEDSEEGPQCDYESIISQNVDLPMHPLYLTDEGVAFTYQQSEVAPYAAGHIYFVIPFGEIMPYLSDEAKAVIE